MRPPAPAEGHGAALAARTGLQGAAAALLACTLAASLFAAAPPPQLEELDELQVTARIPQPLEDFVEFPRYDSVAISPGGTHVAMGWTEDSFQRQLSVVDFPSMKPVTNHVLQIFLGITDLRWVNEGRLLVQPDWPMHGFLRLRESLGSILISDLDGRNLREINGTAPSDLDPIGTLRRDEAIASGPKHLNTLRTDNPDNGKKPDRNALGTSAPDRGAHRRSGSGAVPDHPHRSGRQHRWLRRLPAEPAGRQAVAGRTAAFARRPDHHRPGASRRTGGRGECAERACRLLPACERAGRRQGLATTCPQRQR